MKRFSMFGVVCAAGLLFPGMTGCRGGGRVPSMSESLREEIPIVWESSGAYSRIGRSVRLVVRDQATLAQVPICQIPVDFDKEMVLIAAIGPTPKRALGIRIQRVWREGGRIRVLERHIHPGPGTPTGWQPASPWTVVVVARSDLNVEGYSTRVPQGLLESSRGAY